MVDFYCKGHKNHLVPKGLKELMDDISREVLRVQPDDVYGFIARYLCALLEARKALFIAGDVCEDIRASCCNITKDEAIREDSIDGKDIEDYTNRIVDEEDANVAENSFPNYDEMKHKTNETLDAENAGLPTQDGSVQERAASSYVEAEVYYRLRQKKDFWSHSVFSLPGSYMNLPTSKPYSAYDSIAETSKWPSELYPSSNDYTVDSDRDSLT